MRLKALVVAAALAAGAAFAPPPASAAALSGAEAVQTRIVAGSLLEEVGHRRHRHWRHWHHHHRFGRCARVRHYCAHRWGWGTWRYYRCVHRRGC